MKTQRDPYTKAEYCLIPITNKVSPYRPRAEADVQKTWRAYGWEPPKHDKHK